MKKLLALFALGFLLILALPTQVLAHYHPDGAGGLVLFGVLMIIRWFPVIIAIIMLMLSKIKFSNPRKKYVICLIDVILFVIMIFCIFKYYINWKGIMDEGITPCWASSIILSLNIVVIIWLNVRSSVVKYVSIGIWILYFVLAGLFFWYNTPLKAQKRYNRTRYDNTVLSLLKSKHAQNKPFSQITQKEIEVIHLLCSNSRINIV